jgi:hypothetical protein
MPIAFSATWRALKVSGDSSSFVSAADGVGQDKDPLALVARARFCRAL